MAQHNKIEKVQKMNSFKQHLNEKKITLKSQEVWLHKDKKTIKTTVRDVTTNDDGERFGYIALKGKKVNVFLMNGQPWEIG